MATVTKLYLQSYRSVQGPEEVRFPTKCPVVLVGENNAGKSNIVRGLHILLGQFWPGTIEPEDHEFYSRNRANPIHLHLTFSDDDPFGGRYREIHWKYANDAEPPASFYGIPGQGAYPTGYVDQETAAKAAGVESKPFVARYVAEHLVVDDSGGWGRMGQLADRLRTLIT